MPRGTQGSGQRPPSPTSTTSVRPPAAAPAQQQQAPPQQRLDPELVQAHKRAILAGGTLDSDAGSANPMDGLARAEAQRQIQLEQAAALRSSATGDGERLSGDAASVGATGGRGLD